jgi:hypothetical protein
VGGSERKTRRPPVARTPGPVSDQAPHREPGDVHGMLALQRLVGNRAAATIVQRTGPGGSKTAVVQRDILTLSTGGMVSDRDWPGLNSKDNVLTVMVRLHAITAMTDAEFAIEHPRVVALPAGAVVPVSQMPLTIAAWRRAVLPAITAPMSETWLHLAISDGVGAGLANNKADVAAVQNFVHAQGLLSTADLGPMLDAGERIIVTTSGASVDVTKIPRTMAALAEAKRMLLTGQPFHAALGALTGPLAASETADIAAYTATKTRHDANWAQARQWVEDGFAQNANRMLKNSCEWIKNGRSKVYALTKTHDSAARVTAWGSPGGATWFSYPAGDLYGAKSYYKRKLPTEAYDNTDISPWADATVDGFSEGPAIAVMETALAKGRDYFWSVLKHEIQHSADHHGGTALERYKTEFNAYWLGSREYDAISPTQIVNHMGRDWRARQWAIFNRLYSAGGAYAYVKTAWDNEAALPVAARAFRIAVRDYRRPDTVNPTNSIRVDNFVNAVEATVYADCAPAVAPPNAKVAAVIAAGNALTPDDRHDLAGDTALDAVMRAHLQGKVLSDARKLVR